MWLKWRWTPRGGGGLLAAWGDGSPFWRTTAASVPAWLWQSRSSQSQALKLQVGAPHISGPSRAQAFTTLTGLVMADRGAGSAGHAVLATEAA